MPDTPAAPDAEAADPRFRLAFVPGATPGKWARVWEQRLPGVPLELIPAEGDEALAALRADTADAALVRLPIERDGLHAIPLYTETTVVMLPKDHVLTLAESLTPAYLADEIVQHPRDDVLDWAAGRPPGVPALERPATTTAALELVAAGVGLAVLPQSLARLHHRKDLVYRPLDDPADADGDGDGSPAVAQSRMALVWREDRSGDLMEEFIGIVRGRTVNSSRGTGRRPAQGDPPQRNTGKAGAGKAGTGTSNHSSGRPHRRGGPPAKRRGPSPRGRGGPRGRGRR